MEHRTTRKRTFRVEALEPRHLLAADLHISEFLASNADNRADGDGQFSDWIEVENAGDAAANLDGWYLTDDGRDLQKWPFPARPLAAGEHLLVFASAPTDGTGQVIDDYVDAEGHLHTNFQLQSSGEYLALVDGTGDELVIASQFVSNDDIPNGGGFPKQRTDISFGSGQLTGGLPLVTPNSPAKILVPSSEIPAAWQTNSPFDDSQWSDGTAAIGYDLDADRSEFGNTISVNFNNGQATLLGTTDVAGVVEESHWNNFENNGGRGLVNENPVDLIDGTGANSTTQITWDVGASSFNSNNGQGNQRMMEGWFGLNASDAGHITISDLPAGYTTIGYDVYVYFDSNEVAPSERTMSFTIDGTTIVGKERSANFAGNFSEASHGDAGNYVVFRDLTADSFSLNADSDVGRAAINGLQITTKKRTPPSPDALVRYNSYDASSETASSSSWRDESGSNSWTLAGATLNDVVSANTTIPRAYELTNSGTGVGGDAEPFPAGDVTYELWVRPADLDSAHQVLFETGGGQNGTAVMMTDSGIRLINSSDNTRTADIVVPLDSIDMSDFIQIAAVLNATEGRFDLSVRGSAGGVATTTAVGTVGRGGNRASLFSWGSGLGNLGTPADAADGTFNLGGRTERTTDGETPNGLTQFLGEIARLTVYNGALTPDELENAFDEVTGEPTVDFSPYIQTNVESQMNAHNASILVRVPFEAPTDARFDTLALNVRYDDGFIAYLNGAEVARRNGPTGQATFDAHAGTERPDADAVIAERIDISAFAGHLVGGTNVLAFQALNTTASDRDFLLEPELIATRGEAQQLLYFDQPTPGTANDTTGYLGFVGDTQFDFERGFYDRPIDVAISSSTPSAKIYFTTDGTAPTETNGNRFADTIPVTTTTTLRAAAYLENYIPTNVDTHTYLFLEDVAQQPNNPAGFPTTWAGVPADYEMDPDVVGPENLFDDLYRDTIVDDLKSLPSLSIVMNPDDLFGAQGIYVNPDATGDAWERATSAELIIADGSEPGFQIDSGIRIQGGSSRSINFPKHSMRLEFRSRYGDNRLNYPLFANQPYSDNAIDSFDEIVMRSSFNNSWTHWHYDQAELAQQQRDQWARDIQHAMNQPSTHGRYVHLYLNGVYWGIYNVGERPAAPYQSDYHGGGEDDWDVVNGEGSVVPVDGDKVNWNAMWSVANSGLADLASYNEILSYVDAENLADYIILNFYFGNEDWDGHNWMAARQRSDEGRWRFFAWDSEFAIGLRPSNHATGDNAKNQITNIDRTSLGTNNKVTGLHQRLAQNAEYRLLFADRLRKHFFNDGVLTPDSVTEIWNARADQLDRAMIAESARWGDYRRDVHSNAWPSTNFQLYTYEDHYLPIQDFILNEYLPARSEIAFEQMASRGWYPDLNAPIFQVNDQNQHGGTVIEGDSLAMSGGVAIVSTESSLVTLDNAVKAFVPMDSSLESGPGTRWYDVGFDASTWTAGINGVGYDTGTAYESLIRTDVIDDWSANPTSVYSRFEFDLGDDLVPTQFDGLELKMKYDDGYVAYLNGQLVRSQNAPTPAVWNSRATGKRLDILNTISGLVERTDLSEFIDLLTPGTNVLAIHAINHPGDLDDLLVRPELVARQDEQIQSPIYYTIDGSDPRENGGAILGTRFETGFPIDTTTEVNARALLDGEWSAVTTATFVVESRTANLSITEINYNPHAPSPDEREAMPSVSGNDFEFLEFTNTSSENELSLFGLQLTDGVSFDFGSASLAPGESAVLVEDATAFQLRYGETARVLGEWTGGLSAAGERLRIADAIGTIVVDLTYDDALGWPQRADGAGATLELVDWTNIPTERLSKADSWRGSTDFGGSPGSAGTEPYSVVINEVLSQTQLSEDLSDTIELLNVGDQPVDISGWYLSDAASDLLKFEIPRGTILDPGQFVVFDETDFNPTPLDPSPNDFALSGTRGDDVWLVTSDGSQGIRHFIDDAHFGSALEATSFGRANGLIHRLTPQSSLSLGCDNSQPIAGPLVINEVNYVPADPTEAALAIDASLTSADLEYVELFNPTLSEIDVSGWRIRGGVDYELDAGTTIAAGQVLVVLRFDPVRVQNARRTQAFRSHYGIGESVTLVGGFGGQLNNSGERVTLQIPQPSPIDDPTFTPYVIADEVLYDNLAPWPAIGGANSLNRISPAYFGNSSSSWSSEAASPGVAPLGQANATLGDLTGDGVVDVHDLDYLNTMMGNAIVSTTFDLDGNGNVDAADRDYLLTSILNTTPGDANLDGLVNAIDLNAIGLHWQQQDHCLRWSQGDFLADRTIDARDLNVVGVNWQPDLAAQRTPRAALRFGFSVTEAAFEDLDAHDEFDAPPKTRSAVRAPFAPQAKRMTAAGQRRRNRIDSRPLAEQTLANQSLVELAALTNLSGGSLTDILAHIRGTDE